MIFSVIISCLFAVITASPLKYDDSSRIVNGTTAVAGEFPYIVSIKHPTSHSCGGSILDATHILTAAHCVYGDRNPANYKIQYGVLEQTSDGKNTIKVQSIVYHENYAPGNGYHNDIAIMKLVSAIPLSQYAKKTVLPTQSSATPGNQAAVLVGWGLPYTGGGVMQYLQKVTIKVYTDDDCKKAHGNVIDSRYNLCAGIPEGGKGQCSGDSGGPLTVNGVQVGVVSWSVKPCTVKGYPGVFCKVSTYVNWINNKLATM